MPQTQEAFGEKKTLIPCFCHRDCIHNSVTQSRGFQLLGCISLRFAPYLYH